ncbi:MAG: alpha/beta hydrolase [Aquamicrobium sp.]|uniref:alpha/beta fold hydrolase n=1 Tax=Mesorhizobium sp. Pch-S TaxID=2082387 RepID=UPI0010108725|nr:alpha/beta hydrolase [Mesorhizobium sp. Pch-S]MBR2689002.1 alpha/beta hydrolase [Aquamicrobium sp.]QAZ44435.1 alpha/beta hydrolase [Mesorhizobium sp. Pch-S]
MTPQHDTIPGPAPRIEAFADRLLRVRRPPVDTLTKGETEISLLVTAPGSWPDGAEIRVNLRRRGDGPNVLLVHGWEGAPSDFTVISDKLVAAGFSLWSPDLPGHGRSDGERLSIPLAARVLHAVAAEAGSFALALGHSIGGACLVHALAGGLAVERVVLLATPTRYGSFVRFASAQAGLKGLAVEALMELLHDLIGEHPDWIDMRRQAAAMQKPALFVHSTDDRIVSFTAAKEVASIWRGAQWMAVNGLGHGRLLGDADVVARVIAFACTG